MFEESIKQLIDVAERAKTLTAEVDAVGAAMVGALQRGNKVLSCGNGGSAADAMHLAEELVGKYSRPRRALPGLCLNADPTALTCIANDFGYEEIFARGVEAFGLSGDILVAFTTSGNSRNVLQALPVARRKGVITVLVSGGDGGKARGQCDHELIVPSDITARIQEIHTVFLHSWLATIDTHFE